MSKQTVTINLGGKTISLQFTEFDSEVDVDDLTQIHYSNLIGEILTIPVLLNKVGLLKAEMENSLREATLELDIYEAKHSELYRKQLSISDHDSKGNARIKKPTQAEVEHAVLLDKGYQNEKKRHIRIQKESDYISALYRAISSKDQKINKISEKLRPEEFENELVEGVVNTIMIKKHEKLIK